MEANNMKMMREALVEARKIIKAMGGYWASKALPIIDAALAKPPRNCDMGTAEEQSRRINAEYCTIQKSCYESPSGRQCPLYKAGVDCRLTWAQMPYGKGGAK